MANKKKEVKKSFLNPFNEGVSYCDFLKSIDGTSINEALKSKCSKDEIEWIELEIKTYNKNKNK
jgi:hypothetical protein